MEMEKTRRPWKVAGSLEPLVGRPITYQLPNYAQLRERSPPSFAVTTTGAGGGVHEPTLSATTELVNPGAVARPAELAGCRERSRAFERAKMPSQRFNGREAR